MKNYESLLAAYLVFWAIIFAYQFTVAKRLNRAEDELERLKNQIGLGGRA
jgi:CcmD family protein